jgi:branched-chain amino acid transport system permease protein
MNQIFLFMLLGLGTGALIAGVAVALVAFYRGAGVINLAAGAVSMVAGFTFWLLRGGSSSAGAAGGAATSGSINLPVWAALILTLLAAVAMGLFFEYVIFRPLRNAPPLAKLIGTLGVLLLAQAGCLLAFGGAPQTEPSIVPNNTVQLFGVAVPIDRFILTGIVLFAAFVLASIYRWTRFGLATRAAAESETSAMLIGLSPNLLSVINSIMACVIAAGLGVLAAPLISLDTQNLPLIVVPALAAALFANFTSVSVAAIAGLAIGMAENLLYYASVQSWFPTDAGTPLPGVQDLLVFLLILATMYWRGAKLPGRGDVVERRLPVAPRPERLLRPAMIAVVLGVVALIVLPFDFRQALMNSMIGTILVLSLVLVTGFVGQVSVMQLALSGVAGLVVSHLAVNAGIEFPLAVLMGAVAATVLGLATAVSALRVRGVTLAVVTLAAAVAIQNFGFNNSTWGAGLTGAPVPQPTLFGFSLGNTAPFKGIDGLLPSPVLGFMILAIAIVLCMLVANIRRVGLGQRMLAVRSNERAAAAVGINIRNVKLIAFGIGAFIAGIAGALYGYNFSGISADRFSALTALSLIAFAYIGGITMVSGALFAGFLAVEGISQYAFQKWFGIAGTWAVLLAGIALIGNVIFAPAGGAGMMWQQREYKRQMKEAGTPVPNIAQRAWALTQLGRGSRKAIAETASDHDQAALVEPTIIEQ